MTDPDLTTWACGINRHDIFFSDYDRRNYLDLLVYPLPGASRQAEFARLRGVIVDAMTPHPEARQAQPTPSEHPTKPEISKAAHRDAPR